MAAAVFIMAMAILLRCALADNTTSSILIPDELFSPRPSAQTFDGELAVFDSTTFYTIDCQL